MFAGRLTVLVPQRTCQKLPSVPAGRNMGGFRELAALTANGMNGAATSEALLSSGQVRTLGKRRRAGAGQLQLRAPCADSLEGMRSAYEVGLVLTPSLYMRCIACGGLSCPAQQSARPAVLGRACMFSPPLRFSAQTPVLFDVC